MKITFGAFEAASGEVPFDYDTLCAALSVAQASSPTAQLAMIVDDDRAATPMSSAEHAIIRFRNEPDRRLSPAAVRGNFHSAAALHLMDKVL